MWPDEQTANADLLTLTIYAIKPQFQALLRPLAGALVRTGVTANQVTLAAVVLSLASGAAIAAWPHETMVVLALPPVLLVRMALNAIDGMIAREHGQSSRLGAFFNELGDIVSDAALYLPLALVTGTPAALIVIAVVLAALTETAGIMSVTAGAERRYDGPMGKSDRAMAFGAIALILGLGMSPGIWLTVAMWLMLALLCLTVVNRVRRALNTDTP